MKRLAPILIAIVALAGASARPGPAAAPAGKAVDPTQCGLPNQTPHWIDFADGSVPFWQLFARPGVIAAAANFVYPPQLRAAGAKTIYWDMYLNNRVGTPTAPRDPEYVVDRAHRLFDYAARSSECATPLIAENELFGASLVTPWSASNERYRANVLLYLQTLASRGARPLLWVSSKPYTGSETAVEWWREVAKVSDIVQEVYFSAPSLYAQGPVVANRRLRVAFRNAILAYTRIGIPVSNLGIALGFQVGAGKGGREGLKPAASWFETVKWQALAARQVANEMRFQTIWSWGWGQWGTQGADPDKAAAACVYLWTRSPSLCNAPRMAGPDFDTSRTEGQLRLPRNVQCQVGRRQITHSAVSKLQAVVGDRDLALTALYARAVESDDVQVTPARIRAAERALIALRFGGNTAAYRAALAQARVSLDVARGIIGDELRHAAIEATMRTGRPSPTAIAAFYAAYPDLLARRVHATPAPWWLGNEKDGVALSSLAPPRVFRLGTGRLALVRDMNGQYRVRALGVPMHLGALPLRRAKPAISAALTAFARGAARERWTAKRQTAALKRTMCFRDDMPTPGAVELATFAPFLALSR